MSSEDQLRELLKKRMDETLTLSEQEELDDLMSNYSDEELFKAIEEAFEGVTNIDPSYYNHDWEAIRQKIVAMPRPAKQPSSSRFRFLTPFVVRSRYKIGTSYAAAVVLLIVITGGLWYYFRSAHSIDRSSLPDGNCGLVEPSSKDSRMIHIKIQGSMETVSISPGWQFHTELPDGTEVTLNTASSVTYPRSFDGRDKREVSIQGEVFFDVAQNARQPFIVKAGDVEIRALGTSFNVNAYGDKDSVYATLVEGSVRINSTLLTPGQQAAIALKSSDCVKVAKANLSATGMWRQGYFSFNQSRIDEVMSELSRWYRWEISYASGAKPVSFSATFCRRTPEAEVLQTLRDKGIRFQKTGNKLLIQ